MAWTESKPPKVAPRHKGKFGDLANDLSIQKPEGPGSGPAFDTDIPAKYPAKKPKYRPQED